MFQFLGRSVATKAGWWLILWMVVVVVASRMAPPWDSVTKNGEFGFLPDSSPSRQGEKLSTQAFPNKELASSVVVVVHRTQQTEELTEADRAIIRETLVPQLKELVPPEEVVNDTSTQVANAQKESHSASQQPVKGSPLISRVRSPEDDLTGPLLLAIDGHAALVVVELSTDFLDLRNLQLVNLVEEVVSKWQRDHAQAAGLKYELSGSAVVGRDTSVAKQKSARATEVMTLVLVILLLAIIHRAPLPALIPLVTVYVSVKLSRSLLALMAGIGWIGLFDDIQTFITVIVYGAGVDYCMFLTARYREELDAGIPCEQALAESVEKTGSALLASAGTVIGGIGMLIFAEFGKFQEAGVAIAFSLVVVLCAALTLSSVLLRLAGRWILWPRMLPTSQSRLANSTTTDGASLASNEPALESTAWHRVGQIILKRPGSTLAICLVALTIPSIAALVYYDRLDYGLISNLSDDAPCVLGTRSLQSHFPAGVTGPMSVLIHSDQTDFGTPEGSELIDQLTTWLDEKQELLHLKDVRNVAHPLGITEAASRPWQGLSTAQTIARRGVLRRRAKEHYVSEADSLAGKVTRLELVFDHDPFSREGIANLDRFDPLLRAEVGRVFPPGTSLHLLGSTASIRDLKTVRARDQIRIGSLVSLSVFLILVAMLRQTVVALYLVFSVLLSYTAAYGVTLGVFWMLNPSGFEGLGWKLPLLLFTILVAVGEDYNIFLLSRVEEEQRRHGPVQGVVVALDKTGGIISSCGLIMAGTFSALMFSSLVNMRQLGFALSFGVLLDTFVVRPILVPAFLVMWYGRKEPGQPSKQTWDAMVEVFSKNEKPF